MRQEEILPSSVKYFVFQSVSIFPTKNLRVFGTFVPAKVV